MELTLAKSQGYLKGQPQQNPRLLAVIGVYTGFGSRLKRNADLAEYVKKFLAGLPSTTFIGISLLGRVYTCLLRELLLYRVHWEIFSSSRIKGKTPFSMIPVFRCLRFTMNKS
ncbi:unnamed protein product [Lupinus luteus]|uniref:Uncharacterized protein n=1 Tax=Lupinus luteus TaxID=3873 RepID=A0AAV1WAM3_LUPLU